MPQDSTGGPPRHNDPQVQATRDLMSSIRQAIKPAPPAQELRVKRLALVDTVILASALLCAVVGALSIIGVLVGLYPNVASTEGGPPLTPGVSFFFLLIAVGVAVERKGDHLQLIPTKWRVPLAKWTMPVTGLLGLVEWAAAIAGYGNSPWTAGGTGFIFAMLAGADMGRYRFPRLSFSALMFWFGFIFVILLWYLYHVASLFPSGPLASMNLLSLAAFLAMLIALMVLDVERSYFAVLLEDSPAGAAARRLVPAVLIIPTLSGYLRVQGQLAGLYDTTTGSTLNAAALIGAFGLLIGITTRSLRNVETARKAANGARKESEERFSRMFHSSPVAMTMAAMPEGRYVDVNEAAAKLFGIPAQRALGKTSLELNLIEEPARQKIMANLSAEGRLRDVEIPFQGAGGKPRTVLTSIEPITLTGQRMVLSAFVDITDRKEAEEQLRESKDLLAVQAAELQRSNEELGQFAYVASHDLQEPLRMVASYVQLIERRYKGKLDADADDFIKFAVEGSNRMQSLIQDLLLYSRVGSRGKDFVETPLNDPLNQALENLAMSIEDAHATVKAGALPRARADPGQVMQLFQNLIGNAIKFHGSDPPLVEVTGQAADGWCEVVVKDNGIGIDPKYFERIFVIFQRLHGRDQYAGTGIGLAVCRRIVDRHGGKIWVESSPGAGSAFHFTLPAWDSRGGKKR